MHPRGMTRISLGEKSVLKMDEFLRVYSLIISLL